ncbi:glycoside hydrolase family 16 protein [Rhizobium oryzicola]|uniref:Glycoside hydrolase family 16 protein n=1 Tax=Rhizobium oryzicola TaxID=1232668 RepID=A0ABT8T1N2_9HYPH|nr:glycoside hydrolase family 16 protein [Rhizobium oryzicola]MDO1584178.1 glycoside hydrolase family 16 protein [Rhizobium oryzicola]
MSRTIFPTLSLGLLLLSGSASAQEPLGSSFVENFDRLDPSIWYISDGWNNGGHQNCQWSKDAVKVENGRLVLTFQAADVKDRQYACGEIQTLKRFSYGTYEIRMKAATGSGLNSAFFSYIGPTDKKPHDEIDFEVLGKNTAQVQVNQYINGKAGNEKLVPVAGGADKAYNDYAFIWEENRLRFFVNGKLVQDVTDKAKIPTNPQKIFASLWGTDTLKDWMGTFAYNGPVQMEVDRIAFTKLGESCRFPESVLCTTN